MKKYLTPVNIVIVLLLTGIAMTAIVIFFPNTRNKETLDLLEGQQKKIEQLSNQLQKNDDENRKRDSILLDAYLKNSEAREQQLTEVKTSANEKIDHINSNSFNADSIKRYFANN